MLKIIFLAVSFGFACGLNAGAQAAPIFDPRLAGSAVYSDPGFQEFVETSYGYLQPRNKYISGANLRDAVASPVPAAARKPARARAKAGKFIFVSIQPKARDYSALLEELTTSAGFVLSGERIVHVKNARKTRLLGWVRSGTLAGIRKNPGVAGVRLVRRTAKAL